MSKSAVQSKTYDSVLNMREIREKLSLRYWQNPDLLKSDLEKIRLKRKAGNLKKKPSQNKAR